MLVHLLLGFDAFPFSVILGIYEHISNQMGPFLLLSVFAAFMDGILLAIGIHVPSSSLELNTATLPSIGVLKFRFWLLVYQLFMMITQSRRVDLLILDGASVVFLFKFLDDQPMSCFTLRALALSNLTFCWRQCSFHLRVEVKLRRVQLIGCTDVGATPHILRLSLTCKALRLFLVLEDRLPSATRPANRG